MVSKWLGLSIRSLLSRPEGKGSMLLLPALISACIHERPRPLQPQY